MPEPSDLLSALPRSRPHRRSGKRPARPTSATGTGNSDAGKPTGGLPDAGTPRAAEPHAAQPHPAKPRPAKRRGATAPRGTTPAAKPAAERSPAASCAGETSSIEGGARTRTRPGKPLRQPAQPLGSPTGLAPKRPVPPSSRNVLGTAVAAAGELVELGALLSARAVRNAVSRLPRP